jgi:hypothetical protein
VANLGKIERLRDNKDLEFSCSIYIHNILFPDVSARAFWLGKKNSCPTCQCFSLKKSWLILNPRNGKEVIRSTITLNDICHQ